MFQEDLARAADDPEQMEYLSMIDFAVDCYASAKATKTYLHDHALQNWATNGYMLAWRQHFFANEDSPGNRFALH